MGVKSCNRTGCDNIMCDTYISGIGYICYECKKEFKECLKSRGKTELTAKEIHEELSNFMKELKEDTDKTLVDIDDFFDMNTE